MSSTATITVLRPREEIERLWRDSAFRPGYTDEAGAAVSFRDAPGDRGTEIHVDLEGVAPDGKIRELVQKVTGDEPRAKVMDDLRRFKQVVETGVITRSDGTPEGEQLENQPKQRPAQPVDESEIERAEV